MKPATPILRNEHYLDVMTGGSASLPSPILREERYLAKLAGMEVNIPNPVTIKEKYYAKICGMDVDVPTYTRNMPRIYAYMAKAAGQTIEDLPTAVTREQRYWYDYVSEPPVTEHEYTGAVPYTFTANGEPLLDYLISGNMSQTGTPTPDNPIMPQGCGNKTANLLPLSDKTFTITAYGSNLTVTCSGGNLYFSGTVGEIPGSYTAWKTNFLFELEAGTYYCNNPSPLGNGFSRYIKKYSDDTTILGAIDYTFTLSETTKLYLAFYIYDKNLDNQVELMLNSGSTALPYEPYGYKIPISSASTTTPVYLGEVESTRWIKKLVLTGEESWTLQSINSYGIANLWTRLPVNYINVHLGLSSHLTIQTTLIANTETEGFYLASGDVLYIRINATSVSTANELKAYLAAQYAAGTPVTVWYVLAEPTTGIVNEPFRKIGNYADTLSMEQAGVSIPTNNGSTTVDVDTTLEPSEVYIKYKGV